MFLCRITEALKEVMLGVCTGGTGASCLNCTVMTRWVLGSSHTESFKIIPELKSVLKIMYSLFWGRIFLSRNNKK